MRLRRNIIALGLVSFFTDMASSMVTPILPLFVVLVLDEGVDKVGIIGAITTFVSYILRILGGFLADRFDRNKPFLLIGYGISTFSKPLFAFTGGWVGITAIRSFERLGKAARAAPKDKLITQSAAQGEVGKTFGLHKSLDVAGEMSGLIILMLVLAVFGSEEAVFRNIFRATLIPGVIALGILFFVVQEIGGGAGQSRDLRFALEPSLRRPILIFTLLSFFMFSEAFFVLKGNEIGLSLSLILLLLIGMKGVQVSLSYRIGVVIDRYSSHFALSIGYGLGFLAMVFLLLPGIVPLGISFLLYGAHGVIVLNGIRSLIGNEASDKGATFGFFYLIYAVSSALGALTVGYLWEFYSVTAATLFSCLGVGSMLLLSILSRRRSGSFP